MAALVWANVSASSYDSFWSTQASIRIGGSALELDLRHWVNSGLMTFFFFVLGLEARREFDLGELRERRRVTLPLLAALTGMAIAALTYVAFNLGGGSVGGWGVAMSTDTAFALGLLALVGPGELDRLRAFLLTVVVADDLVALAVIATVYSHDVSLWPLLLGAALFASVRLAWRLGVRSGGVFLALGAASWAALVHSGIEPVIVGLAMGLLAYASPASRSDLEQATTRFREFREQPTPQLARSVSDELRSAISPNDRLQHLWHPVSSYAIVPLFALANAGVALDRDFLGDALTSPITLGIVCGYVLGKPLGIVGATVLATRLSGGRLRPPVGWAAVASAGTIAGIGFTVSLLVASVAFEGRRLEEAKLGILVAAAAAAIVTWLVFRVTAVLPERRRLRALLGSPDTIVDLYEDVDPEVDHVRGPLDAPVTLVEYGDFECPYCGSAEAEVREVLRDFADVRYVWRHLPLMDVHPRAQLAAEAAEAASAQGRFWDMYDLLLSRQDELAPKDLVRHAEALGLDVDRFTHDLREHVHAGRIARDVDSADLSAVSGTPTFFVNGSRHYGAYDVASLSAAVRAAGAASLAPASPL